MTTKDVYYSLELATASDLGRGAAQAGIVLARNPFKHHTPAASQWDEAYRTELARESVRRGEISAGRDELDSRERQWSFWGWLFGSVES